MHDEINPINYSEFRIATEKCINIRRGMLSEVCQANCSCVGNLSAVTAPEVVEFPGDGFHTPDSEVEVALHNH